MKARSHSVKIGGSQIAGMREGLKTGHSSINSIEKLRKSEAVTQYSNFSFMLIYGSCELIFFITLQYVIMATTEKTIKKDFTVYGVNYTAKLFKNPFKKSDSYEFIVRDSDYPEDDDIFVLEDIPENKVNHYYFNEYLDFFLDYIS